MAAERYENATSQVEINKENLDVIQAQINAILFILAKTNFDRANSNLVQSKYSFLLQEKILNFYENGDWRYKRTMD